MSRVPDRSRPAGSLTRAWRAAIDMNTGAARHERAALPVPVAGDSAWTRIDGETLDAISNDAWAERTDPWPRPTATHYARYFRDGNRTDYEHRVAACQARLTRAVVLTAAAARGVCARSDTDRDRWLDEAIDGITVLCELSTWCWAAHEVTCAMEGTIVPDPARPVLDLGAGEVAAQLAWTDHVLGPVLDGRAPGLRSRMRHEVQQRVLRPFRERDDWHWLGYDGHVHNWCPWICGNVVAAALVFDDDEAELARTLTRAVDGVDRFLASLPADGSVDEGYEYWWNGACRALEALELLEHASDGHLDGGELPIVRSTVRFPYSMHLGGEWYLNFADARARPPRDQPWHVLHRWARRVGDAEALAHAAAHRRPGYPVMPAHTGLGRLLSALHDADWLATEPRPSPLIESVWLPGTQVAVARQSAGSAAGLTMAVKGGHNGENHNHNDVGSVVVAVDGMPALIDVGRPTYTAQTFGPDRYDIWTMQSTWHNVPEVCGTPQGQGRQFHARDVDVTDTSDQFAIRLDLSTAYPVDTLRRWWRTAEFNRKEYLVVIRDEWEFGEEPPADAVTSVNYLLAGDVERLGAGELLVQPGSSSRAVRLTWNAESAADHVTVRELDDPMHSEVWGPHLTRLDLRVPPTAQGALTLAVEAVA